MRSIAIVNQKGGCGKTTTTVNLAGALAADGFRVLVADMDPQAHSCLALGVDADERDVNLYDVLSDESRTQSLESILVHASEGIDLAPSSIILSALEQKLATERQESRINRLADALDEVRSNYDFVLIDCPPNVGLLTFNALRAAREVIIPLEASVFAIDGVQKLLETIHLLSDRLSHPLGVRILPTLYDGRTRHARQTLGEIRERFADLCFDAVIRQNVKLREAALRGKPVAIAAPTSNGTMDYASLALEVQAQGPPALAETRLETSQEPTTSRQIEVCFRDDDASDVRIAGDFNGWVPDKGVRSLIETAGSTRVWTKVLQLPPGTYEYRFVVDGEWQEDPENPKTVTSAAGRSHSVLVVP